MKLELQANDYIDIHYLSREDDDYVNLEMGILHNDGTKDDIKECLHQVPIDAVMRLLGYNISRIKYALYDYLLENNAFIRAKKTKNKAVEYSFNENVTEEELACSTDFASIVDSEVFKKGNNTNI